MKRLNNKTLTAINNRLLSIHVCIDYANKYYFNVNWKDLKTKQEKEMYYYGAYSYAKGKLDQISLYKDHGIMMTAPVTIQRWIDTIEDIQDDAEMHFTNYHDFKYPNRKAAA